MNRRYVVVATNYFTKWVEVETLTNIRDADVKKFIWKNIMTRFGFPCALVSDNGLQFYNKVFREYCTSLRITNRYSSPTYPQSSGHDEATNKTIVNGLKKRLEGTKGNWVKELPNILWANQITPRRSTCETPFSMIYDAKVVIPVEVSLSSSRVAGFTQGHNNECMVGNLDALEEWKDMVAVRLANYQQRLAQGYNRRVKPQEFVQGDLVLRKAIRSTKDQSVRKLAPNWEGPY